MTRTQTLMNMAMCPDPSQCCFCTLQSGGVAYVKPWLLLDNLLVWQVALEASGAAELALACYRRAAQQGLCTHLDLSVSRETIHLSCSPCSILAGELVFAAKAVGRIGLQLAHQLEWRKVCPINFLVPISCLSYHSISGTACFH